LLCAENLYQEQKELFREVFKARVYCSYGHAEDCFMAGFCDQEDYYHAYSEFGYAELVDQHGRVLPWTEGQRGEIVGTALINDVMPLIRYRTGDIAVAGPPECSCGRRYPLLKFIEGRKQEYVVTADGRTIALTALVFGQHWDAFVKMRQIQFVQEEPGRILVRIVKEPAFVEEDEREIREKMCRAVGSGLDVTFDYVNYIPPTARGKHIFLKQSLKLPSAWAGSIESHQQERP
jgi:phenylacetate-CoA ligase